MSAEYKEYFDFLKIQHSAFMCLGLNIEATSGKYLIINAKKLIFYTLSYSCVQYGLFNHVVNNILDIDKVSAELSVFNHGLLLAIKIMLIVLKKDTLIKLIRQMIFLAKGGNSTYLQKWTAENRRSMLMTKSYVYSCLISAFLIFIVPVVILIYRLFKGLGFRLNMPYEVVFPFDNGSPGFAIFVYVLTFYHVSPLMYATIGVDTLFGWYIHAISAHFRILRLKIHEMGIKICQDNNHKEFIRDVASFVRYHNKTLQFLKDLNYLFGEILWAEVIMSCLQTCFMLYTLSNVHEIMKTPFDLMAFLTITIQLLIYCFGGEKITNENDILCNDIYMELPWEKMYPSERKLMLLPLMRTQREASLKGLFFNLNRNLLVFIFKTAFSFITLLGAIKESNAI